MSAAQMEAESDVRTLTPARTGTSSHMEAPGSMWECPLCHNFGANQLLPLIPQEGWAVEGFITSENISLVSLVSFQEMTGTVLNAPEDVEKVPIQEREAGIYLGGL